MNEIFTSWLKEATCGTPWIFLYRLCSVTATFTWSVGKSFKSGTYNHLKGNKRRLPWTKFRAVTAPMREKAATIVSANNLHKNISKLCWLVTQFRDWIANKTLNFGAYINIQLSQLISCKLSPEPTVSDNDNREFRLIAYLIANYA